MVRVFLPTMHAKINAKHDLCVPYGVLRLFVIMLRSWYMQVPYAPGEPWLFWLWEKSKIPKFSLMPGSRWHRFWDLWCISIVETSHLHENGICRIFHNLFRCMHEEVRLWLVNGEAFGLRLYLPLPSKKKPSILLFKGKFHCEGPQIKYVQVSSTISVTYVLHLPVHFTTIFFLNFIHVKYYILNYD